MGRNERKGATGMLLATAEQMKRLDEGAIAGRGIPSTLLMERAARGILEAVRGFRDADGSAPPWTSPRYVPDAAGRVISGGETAEHRRTGGPHRPRCAVFSGPGNNGGDGVAVAGLLVKEGWAVRAFLVGSRAKMTPDCREMERRLAELGGRLEDFRPDDGEQRAWAMSADVIVDALFGIGLNSAIRGDGVAAVDLINDSPARVVAADIASGVEADTGRVLGAAVRADATVTFTLAKPGHFVGKGGLHTGRLTVHDIGIPRDLLEGEDIPTLAVTAGTVRGWLPRRPADGHKGTFGKDYILAGSVGYTGAPVLAARAACRTGAGLVFLDVPGEVYPIVAVKCDEAMPRPLPSEDGMLSGDGLEKSLARLAGCDAALLGPGLGRSGAVERFVLAVLEGAQCPVVLDADGLNAAAAHIDRLDACRAPLVLTPHDGEFARLGGDLSGEDRLEAARAFAREHGCVVVLKGHRTITAHPDGRAAVNTTGNSGMAKGGSGDVLSGVILALLGMGMAPFEAAAAGVYLHGLAGDLCAGELGEWGMLPTDLPGALPRALRQVLE